ARQVRRRDARAETTNPGARATYPDRLPMGTRSCLFVDRRAATPAPGAQSPEPGAWRGSKPPRLFRDQISRKAPAVEARGGDAWPHICGCPATPLDRSRLRTSGPSRPSRKPSAEIEADGTLGSSPIGGPETS